MAKQLIRPKEAQKRLGIGRSKFWEDFIRTGRLKLVPLGPNCVAVLEEELDALIDEMIEPTAVSMTTTLPKSKRAKAAA